MYMYDKLTLVDGPPPVPLAQDRGHREELGSQRHEGSHGLDSNNQEDKREERDIYYGQQHGLVAVGPRILDHHQEIDYDYFAKDTDQVSRHRTESQWAIKSTTIYDYDVLAYQCTDHTHHGAWVIGMT